MKKATRTAPTLLQRDIAFQDELSLVDDQIGTQLFHRVSVVHSPLASRITWHSHKYFELLFLAEGATSYEFVDGRIIDLPGGHFLVIPPGVQHRGLSDVRHPVRLCGMMLNFSSKHSRQLTPFTAPELKWIHHQCVEGAVTVCRMNAELRRMNRSLSQLMASSTSSDPMFASVVRLNLCSFLVEAARQLTTRRTLETSRTVEAATRYMESHFTEPLAMDDVAAASMCSRARLFRVFKEFTGMTPNNYLQRLRLKHAQSTLLSSRQSITTIALNSGFSTSQYFCTVFRKYTGTTPADFRKQRK